MSSEEKRAWIHAGVALGVPVVYFAVVLARLSGTDPASVPYVGPMLTAVGVAIVAGIVLNILAAVVRPGEAGRKDERDHRINRFGDSVGFYVMSIAAVVPLALALVLSLLYLTFNSLRDALIIFAGVLFAGNGGIFALWYRHMPFTISAGVGFIALAGASMLMGLVLVSSIHDRMRHGVPKREAIREAALLRLRPVLMTGTVAALEQSGVAFRNDVVDGPGGRQIVLADPAGNPVELFEAR